LWILISFEDFKITSLTLGDIQKLLFEYAKISDFEILSGKILQKIQKTKQQ